MYAIYYINKNIANEKLNYTIIVKRIVVVYALNKFHHYVIGFQLFVHTKHSTIKYLMKKIIFNARIIQWLSLLQEFIVTTLDKPGREDVVADLLSRLTRDTKDEP